MIRRPFVLALALHALLTALFVVGPARADDRRAEAQAQDALQGAQAEYATGAYGAAIARLTKAYRACGRCAAHVRGLLARDLGAIETRGGNDAAGYAHFLEALKLDPNGDLSPRYDTTAVRAAWTGAKDEASLAGAQQPSGDFSFVPPAEQTVRTPIPLYFEIDMPVVKVTVRYKATGAREYARLELARMGKGWAGEIPCADVALGVVRYYIVGLDSMFTPIATGGDPHHPYFVRVRKSITEPPPTLPGQAPPKQCSEGSRAAAPAPVTKGRAAPEPSAPEPPVTSAPEAKATPTPKTGPRGYSRVWIGVAGSVDISSLPAADDVCRVDASGQPTNSAGYVCADPHGATFPANKTVNDAIAPGRAGTVGGGFAPQDVRILLAVDYAVTSNLLLGGRVGYVTNGYVGQANSVSKGFSLPLHLEARLSYVFGDEPLAQNGFAPVLLVGAGIAEADVGNVVQVTQTGVAGQEPIVAWKASGPLYATAGGGVRYTLSPAFAFTSVARLAAAFGNGVLFSVVPEIALQYGF